MPDLGKGRTAALAGAGLTTLALAGGLSVMIMGSEPETASAPEEGLEQDVVAFRKAFDRVLAEQDRKRITPAPGQPVRKTKFTRDQIAGIRSRMKDCWDYEPIGRPPHRSVPIHFNVRFRQDGSVEAVEPVGAPEQLSDAEYSRAVDEAQTAIYACAPYTELLESPYESWKLLKFAFDATKGVAN